ncbi:MAG: peptide chain release factor 2 [Alphaproteobacteria bacterium]|nr:peptide chain release factor 2 [Alphaproteobacteria bacterium]
MDLTLEFSDIREAIDTLRGYLDPAKLKADLADLEAQASDENLWNDADKAKTVLQKKSAIEKKINDFESLVSDFATLKELYDLDNNDADVAVAVSALHKRALAAKDMTLFSGEADNNNAFLFIQAGAGGTEAQDWAGMLYRMYVRWAERKGFAVEVIEEHHGEEAGMKSATLRIIGDRAYGWLKNEVGVHRLVRISPFDSNARRHTSFSSVDAWPDVSDDINIEINDKDLRIDTYRSSGAGGQHVNKTDSAVRITHLPTNAVVQCQTERSQIQNRETAMKMLKSKLYELEMRKREEAENAALATQKKIEWGSQIRSYVLQPYQMVKDLRTGVERTDPNNVLDGDIDDFMIANLKK